MPLGLTLPDRYLVPAPSAGRTSDRPGDFSHQASGSPTTVPLVPPGGGGRDERHCEVSSLACSTTSETRNTPSHASLTSRVDLLLKREQIVIEAKMTRASLGQRKVAEELAVDKELYRSHPDCKMLVCFVYDSGRHLTNPTGLEDDLTDPEGPLPTFVAVAH